MVKFGNGEGEAIAAADARTGQKRVLELQPPDASPIVTAGAAPIRVTATLFKEDSHSPDQPFRQVSTYISATEGLGMTAATKLAVDIVIDNYNYAQFLGGGDR